MARFPGPPSASAGTLREDHLLRSRPGQVWSSGAFFLLGLLRPILKGGCEGGAPRFRLRFWPQFSSFLSTYWAISDHASASFTRLSLDKVARSFRLLKAILGLLLIIVGKLHGAALFGNAGNVFQGRKFAPPKKKPGWLGSRHRASPRSSALARDWVVPR